jgi:hypothetical protein
MGHSDIEDISDEKFERARENALALFQKNKRISSPCFGEVRIDPDGFGHLEWKSKDHKRTKKAAYMRYLCFLHVPYILQNMKLYQEYREVMEDVPVKKKGKIIKERKPVRYYGFVAIVNGDRQRVKIVVKRVDGWGSYVFASAIPRWDLKGYSGGKYASLFFDDEDEDEEGRNQNDTKGRQMPANSTRFDTEP